MTSAAVPDRRGQTFRTDVQGLRAVAVGLVLLYHAGVPFITGGYVGVDAFFVISGYLITTHLLQSLQRDGRIRFADFYARRIRRILPASLTVAVLTAIAAVVFYPPLALERVLRDGWATVMYVPNIWFAVQQTDYLADQSPSPYQHYWSLGVEEQFYLFWPLLLLLLFVLFRRRRALVTAGIAVVAAASLALGIVLTQIDPSTAFFSLPTRAWQLLAGGLVGALLLRGAWRVPAWLAAIGGWLGLGMLLVSAVVFDSSTAFPGSVALIPTVGTALVIAFGAQNATAGPTFLLSLRPMQFVGLISYSLYLVHWPLLVITQASVGEESPLPLVATVLLGVILPLPLAWLLFRFVETPARSPRILTARRPRVTLLTALATSVVLVAGSFATVQWAAVRPLGTSAPVATAPDFPVSPPTAVTFVPQNLRPSLDAVAKDLSPVYTDGCHLNQQAEDVQDCVYGDADATRDIAVFGDSHSAQWFPAIEAYTSQHPGFSIHAYTKSSCSAATVTVLVRGVPYAACDRWRQNVLDHLEQEPPDLVVISSYAHYELPGDPTDEERAQTWRDGLSDTVSRLQAAGSRVLIIADTPRLPAQPSTCLSKNVRDVSPCATDRAWALDSGIASAERDVAEQYGEGYRDLTEFICDAETCPTIIDDIQVYRDVNHLTATFVSYLAPAIEPDLARLLGTADASSP